MIFLSTTKLFGMLHMSSSASGWRWHTTKLFGRLPRSSSASGWWWHTTKLFGRLPRSSSASGWWWHATESEQAKHNPIATRRSPLAIGLLLRGERDAGGWSEEELLPWSQGCRPPLFRTGRKRGGGGLAPSKPPGRIPRSPALALFLFEKARG